MRKLIDQLARTSFLTSVELLDLLDHMNEADIKYLHERAIAVKKDHYGDTVYMRGLIEFTNYCTNDCLYCGIRKSNRNAERYRLTKEQILECCEMGNTLGYRTFVLQGGDDPYYTDERIVDLITAIKTANPDCAITLSIGEKSYEAIKNIKMLVWIDTYFATRLTLGNCTNHSTQI
jgi:biotin synthase